MYTGTLRHNSEKLEVIFSEQHIHLSCTDDYFGGLHVKLVGFQFSKLVASSAFSTSANCLEVSAALVPSST